MTLSFLGQCLGYLTWCLIPRQVIILVGGVLLSGFDGNLSSSNNADKNSKALTAWRSEVTSM